ncbi:MAG: hypothetical protein ACRDRA_06895 [Pseudonocardiaceae bacterium]
MTTISSTGITFVQAAERLAMHLVHHQLPEPALMGVTLMWGHPQVRVQLHSQSLADVVAGLLIWTRTLSTVTVEAWRVPQGGRVQLSIASTLASPTGGVIELDVYGDCAHDPILITDLAPGEKRVVSLGELRAWAASNAGATSEGGAA